MPMLIPFLQRPFFQAHLVRRKDDRVAAGSQKPSRILIVEDDYIVGLDLENQLIAAGFDVIGVASSGKEALKLAAAGKPDLAIMDVGLSGTGDGVDTAVALLDTAGVRSIFVTGFDDPETRERAAAAAPLGWLVKPYFRASLFALLDKALSETRHTGRQG